MVARSFEPLEPKRLNPNFRLFLSHYLYVVAVILVVMQRRPLMEVAAALGKEAGTAWTPPHVFLAKCSSLLLPSLVFCMLSRILGCALSFEWFGCFYF